MRQTFCLEYDIFSVVNSGTHKCLDEEYTATF